MARRENDFVSQHYLIPDLMSQLKLPEAIPSPQNNFETITLDPPPTPEEYHEALMNPLPGHSPLETIKHNRELKQ